MTTDTESVDGNVVTAVQLSYTGTGDGTLTSLLGTQMALSGDDISLVVTNAATAGAEIWTVKSRLRGTLTNKITTGVAFPATGKDDQAGFSVTITAGATAFVLGDEFVLETTSDEGGTFLKFFRDTYKLVPPVNLAGAETILDSLAE